MKNKTVHRWLGGALAGVLMVGSCLVIATPAYAAPGDASADALTLNLDLDLGGIDVGPVTGPDTGSSVSGSGTDSFTLANVNIDEPPLTTITTGAVTSSATSDAAGSSASAQIARIDATLFDQALLTSGTAQATASCPTGGTPTASASVEGLEVLGSAVTLTANEPPQVITGTVVSGPLTDLTIAVTVQQTVTTDATTAAATAVTASIRLTGDLSGTPVDVTVGTITLAQASCEAPAVVPVTATSIDPAVGPTVGGQEVTIEGSGFVEGVTTVTFAGTSATSVSVTSPTTLTAITPAGPAGPTQAVVSNPGSQASLGYTYVAPTIVSMSPTQGPAAGGTTVTLSGAGLSTTTGVTFGGVPATVVSVAPDGSQVVVENPPGLGYVDVALTLAGGTVLPAPSQYLYVSESGGPVVTGLTPDEGPASGGTTVTITGSGFAGTTDVRFDGVSGTIVGTPTNTQIVVTTPPGAAGPADVSIITPLAASVAPDAFLYIASPTAGGIDPGSGPTTGGTTVTIDGSGFVPGATTVTICGRTIAASSVSVAAGGTRLTFVTPPCAAGVSAVTVSTAGGTTAAFEYRYVSPSPAAAGGGTSAGGGALARTGSTVAPVAVPIALLLTGGIVLLIAMRRRRMS